MTYRLVINVRVGEPIFGQWCDRCLLPSRIEIPLYRVHDDGTETPLATAGHCTDHTEDDE